MTQELRVDTPNPTGLEAQPSAEQSPPAESSQPTTQDVSAVEESTFDWVDYEATQKLIDRLAQETMSELNGTEELESIISVLHDLYETLATTRRNPERLNESIENVIYSCGYFLFKETDVPAKLEIEGGREFIELVVAPQILRVVDLVKKQGDGDSSVIRQATMKVFDEVLEAVNTIVYETLYQEKFGHPTSCEPVLEMEAV